MLINKLEIDQDIVRKILTSQYVQWADLPLLRKTILQIHGNHHLNVKKLQSKLSKMNGILFFDDYKTVEDGNHEELVAKNSHYAKMWRMQAGGFLPKTENSIKGT